jgi:diguanylate cyclase (GGDEF)-like protein
MESQKRYVNLFLLALLPVAIWAFAWAVAGLSADLLNTGVFTIAALTVFSSCFLRVQLPRVNIHFTISDALLILSILMYGGEVAVLIAAVETAAASLNMRRQGLPQRFRTVFANIMIAAIGVFAATRGVTLIFGQIQPYLHHGDSASDIWLLLALASLLFAVNSVLVAVYWAIKNARPIWKVWSENCVDAMIMYLSGGVMAGFLVKALEQINLSMLIAVIVIFAILFLTFRRFVEDVKRSAEKAQLAERQKAEEAEKHVGELKHYISELEQSGEALQRSHERFRHAAYHDSLTGLPNRNYFIDTLRELLDAGRANRDCNFAVLIIDLRSFKTINDSLGHTLGDQLIKNVAARLVQMVRVGDMAARFGGDKFGILLKELHFETEARQFADLINRRISEPYTLDGRQVFTNAKIGIAYGNPGYEEAEDIFRDADIAMYYAKENLDNTCVFDQNMHIRAVTRLQLETDLRFAIERKEFELYYQPIIDLGSAGLVGFEALVRWNHPKRGLVSPNEFIPISESTGLIVPMTVQILNSACTQVAHWQSTFRGDTPLSVAVNLSGKHFAHRGLVDQIREVIDATGIDPFSLKLELTESALMENAEQATQMLRQIKETGVQISIDDFGTGYSSLSYLHRFPIDLLKIDRSFVGAMESDEENGEIVQTVTALAKSLGLKVVAEGIETLHQFQRLRDLGCDFGQGYLFSKPIAISEIDVLLNEVRNWRHLLQKEAPLFIPLSGNAAELPLS